MKILTKYKSKGKVKFEQMSNPLGYQKNPKQRLQNKSIKSQYTISIKGNFHPPPRSEILI